MVCDGGRGWERGDEGVDLEIPYNLVPGVVYGVQCMRRVKNV